jgi:fatty-acyl-CoA synthase
VRTDWFEKWARYSPDAVALKDADTGSSTRTRQASDVVNRTARLLQDEHGITAGDRVAVLSMNELEYVLLLFAAQKVGAILVPLNFRLAPRRSSSSSSRTAARYCSCTSRSSPARSRE